MICESVFESLVVTDDMAASVEKETRSQSKCTLWYKHRAGRVTSSHMKVVCHTDSTNPAQSLVKLICYPMELNFSSKETNWGKSMRKQQEIITSDNRSPNMNTWRLQTVDW